MTTIEQDLEAELTRLLALPLTPEETEIARRYYSQKERESMDESDFCGPHRSFPVKSQEDVTNAAGLAGHADDPSAVRACIISKAKSHGWSLPESWQKDKEEQRADVPVSAEGTHEPTSGSHSHKHPAYGDQGEDGTHEHSHSHDGDNDHKHAHAEEKTEKSDDPDILRSMPAETTIFAPILRIDQAKREVVVRATAEDLDSYGTVISFEGSKEAFSRWRGNIREMHDASKAVGRAIKWEPLEEEKAIDLTLRVSRGSEDTWQKVVDGTLSGASIGARNGKWAKKSWKGQEVPFLDRYDLVEVSLVDNPSCPGCDVKIVRMDGAGGENFLATDVLDFSEEATRDPAPADTPIERRGARVATNTMGSMHKSRDHALQGIRETLANCSCDECQSALRVLDPDGDGDIDIVPSLDTDKDRGGAGAAAGDGSGIMKAVAAEITRQLGPTVQRMSAIAARLAATGNQSASAEEPAYDHLFATAFETTIQPTLNRRIDLLEEKLARLDGVPAVLTEVKDLAARIAAQPQPGGPIVNSSIARTMGREHYDEGQADLQTIEAEVIARLAKSGILSKDQQVNAALHLQRVQQQAASARR